MASVRGRFSWPGYSTYQISKYGVETMSDSLRLEMVKFGVKVSLIEPGRYGGATSAASPEMVDIFTVYYRIWRSRHGQQTLTSKMLKQLTARLGGIFGFHFIT
jgi:NAD(P)-dependent dehydrogenase (short-subunit alcohol dehydrogenase family)